MKRLDLYIIILLIECLLTLTACHDSLALPEETPRAEAERTVIIYMAGDNSLSDSRINAAQADTVEMSRARASIPENVNFIIYLDSKQQVPAIYELNATDGMKLWKQYDGERLSTDKTVMLEALQDIVRYFPARHYGLTLWSHATGWVPERQTARRRTFGKDENSGTTSQQKKEMEIPVLKEVLSQLPRFDYIFFDACFMQCIEVAYELRGQTDFMVGSPAEIPGPGAPYHLIMKALCEGDAKGIVEGYDSGYPGSYGGYYYQGVLLSCIDCTQLEALAEATGRFLIPRYMEHAEPSASGFQAYCSRLVKYNYYFDMRTTMCRLLSEDDYAAWMEYFDRAVPTKTFSSTRTWYSNNLCNFPYIEDTECYGGVSMFVPLQAYEPYGWNADFQETSWYEALGWAETGW